MGKEGLREDIDLEKWIVDHPEVLDPTMKVITTQYNQWSSAEGSSLERPDVIGLLTSGELVVIELKREADKKIHLQALTYAALVSRFTLDVLAQEHAAWYNKHFRPAEAMSAAQAREELESFVETDEDSDEELVFALPRIILVAPEFPPTVLTTVQWLSEVAPDVTVECHQFQLFKVPVKETEFNVVASFNRIFPVEDMEKVRLRAQSPRIAAAKEQLSRKPRAVARIVEKDLIPKDAEITFDPSTRVHKESVATVHAWLNADPARKKFAWDPHPTAPLRWSVEPDKRWGPTALRDELFKRAGAPTANFAATEVFFRQGEHLAAIAEKEPFTD